MPITSLDGLWPYFRVHLLFTWHDLCDWFGLDGNSVLIQYISAFLVFLTLSRLRGRLGGVLSLAIHISPNNGPINMIPYAKPLYYILPISFECSIMSIRPLVAKLQQVYGLCGR